jgi:hypothetical protein
MTSPTRLVHAICALDAAAEVLARGYQAAEASLAEALRELQDTPGNHDSALFQLDVFSFRRQFAARMAALGFSRILIKPTRVQPCAGRPDPRGTFAHTWVERVERLLVDPVSQDAP